jgi:ribosome modulation factor
MRTPAPLRNALLLLLLASPALVLAQFQAPTDEELKMTADPKAPGAAAVYLNVEEIANDPQHYQSFYARIKVLQEKGKELATVEVPYLYGNNKITDIKARTIHADGTVISLVGKPEDLMISKRTGKDGDPFQINRKVFTLPSVEVGSILEYRYELRYDDNHFSSPDWEIQRLYFVHKAHYVFTPFKAFMPGIQNATSTFLVDAQGRAVNTLIWWPRLPQGVNVKTDVVGHYSVDVADIPATPDEEWMPPIYTILYKVIFYYKSSTSALDFWVTEAKDWSKEVDHFAEPTKSIKEAVSGLIAPSDSELDKAKKLYKAVQALDNTDYSRRKSESELKQLKLKEAKRAEDTWKQKSGSSEDIARLYLSMLRAAGLSAYALKVVDRERGLFDPSYLSLDQLDDTLVAFSSGGKEIVLDPGEKMCPFQTLNWRHSGASGIRQAANTRGIGTSPLQPYAENKTTRIGDLTLDSHGAVTGSLRFVMAGQEALRWRQMALRNDEDEVKKSFDRGLETTVPQGIEAHIDHFLALDDPDVNLVAVIKVEGSLGSATSKRLLLPGYFFETRNAHPFVAQDKRLEPVDMHYGDLITDQITYHLPAGFSVEGAPQDAKIPWPEHAVLTTKTVSSPGQIIVARSLARGFTFAKPEEYKDLRGFYQKIADSDQQQLVLTASPAANAASPAAKGN